MPCILTEVQGIERRGSTSCSNDSARRSLPKWRADTYRDRSDWRYGAAAAGDASRDVMLFADTFNRYFERENLDAALRVLAAGGYRVHALLPNDGDRRPLCCGRTFLSVGQVAEAKREMARTLSALAPYAARGMPVIGLEPSCLLTFRDEMPALIKNETVDRLAANALLLEEFIAREQKEGRLNLPLAPLPRNALLHGHCHQKAFDAMGAVESVLQLIPELTVETVESSCCGMAGSFGFDAATIDVSEKMGELSLLPAVRKADADALIVADGTSCRHRIHDGAGRAVLHVARVLEMSLEAGDASRSPSS